MPLWPSKPKQSHKSGVNTTPIALDGGVNKDGTIFNIGQNQAWDCLNTSSDIKGALTLEKAPYQIDFFDPVHEIQASGVSRSLLHVVTNGVWKSAINIDSYLTWSNRKTDVPLTAKGSIIDFQGDGVLYTILASNDGVWSWDGTTVTELVNAPKTDLYAVDDYRLYALMDNNIYASAPNDPTTWPTKISLVGALGDSTAILSHKDKIYCFTTGSVHILYGDDEGNFDLSGSYPYGCISSKAATIYKDDIYFVSADGLYKYNGYEGFVNISKAINSYIVPMIEGVYKLYCIEDKLYMQVNSQKFMLHLDEPMKWHKISNKNLSVYMMYAGDLFGNMALGVAEDGVYYCNNKNANTTAAWQHTTPMRFIGFNKQTISSMPILFYLPINSTMKLEYNTNPNTPSWQELYTFTANATVQNQLIYIPMDKLNNVDMYQLKLSGTGDFVLYYIGDDGRVKIR